MLFALAGSGRHSRRRVVIVGDRLLCHRNEEIQRRHDAVKIRDCRAVHHVLQSEAVLLSTLKEALSTVNTGRESTRPSRPAAGPSCAPNATHSADQARTRINGAPKMSKPRALISAIPRLPR